ncbi:hypothetical protein PENSPDRAFT_659809 [Peniophora sp. CONT]|nr:hypothetical protein PENSPDRAFT_659809 [Peniophora sp. CONT]
MGSIISAIGGAIMAVISAIAGVIETIVGGIVSVLLAIWDFFLCIICCRCGSGARSGGRRSRRRGGAATY